MARTIWLAAAFLIFISGLAALMISIGAPAKQQAYSVAETVGSNIEPVLPKADKLNVSYVDGEPFDKTTIRLVPVAVTKVAEPEPRQKTVRIISRHWHEGDGKVIKGTADRDASLPKRKEFKEGQFSPIETFKSWIAAKKT